MTLVDRLRLGESPAGLLSGLVQEGKILLAQQLRRELGPGIDLSADMAEQANAGPSRALIFEEMHAALLKSGGANFGAKYWLRYMCLAEFNGRISDLCRGLQGALSWLNVNMSARASLARPECVAGFELACALFDITAMRRFSLRCHDIATQNLWNGAIDAYETAMRSCGLDPAQPHRSLMQMAANDAVALQGPTVIIRVKADFWRKLARGKMRTLKGRFDPILLADEVLSREMNCLFIPQFSNAGPNFSTPYSQRDPNLIAVLGYHKYCYRPSTKLLNYRSYLKGRYLVDAGGYSGWTQMPELHHIVEHTDHVAAKAFCDDQRAEIFGSYNHLPEIPNDRPYLFIPLQLQNDSVTALAYSDPEQMVEACRRHFTPRGWNIVIKKHPKDTSPEINALIDRVAKHPDVTVATSPSPALVRNAGAVALVNSSVGWEAVLANKPILAFGRAEYSAVTYEIHCDADLETANLVVDSEQCKAQDALYYHFMTKQTDANFADAAGRIGRFLDVRLASEGVPSTRYSEPGDN